MDDYVNVAGVEVGWQRVLQVDLEVDAVAGGVAAAAAFGAAGSHSISWQVEYPPGRGLVLEADTHLQLAQRELGGIVPLAMNVANPGGSSRSVVCTLHKKLTLNASDFKSYIRPPLGRVAL
ncbi:hypothetical protein AALO_G00069790 [Alosa alosa]|uniref:Uncharacterized protein n=1 Tax=Alosa alosa TaxID=278164 RepID=A0AAV6H2F3_9TELE|nr:hypothetical protein AALO_G00069790 [Alosa alosa]